MKIGLHINRNRDKDFKCALTTIKAITKLGAVPVLLPELESEIPNEDGLISFEEFEYAKPDVMVSIGGDGTFLAMISENRELDTEFIGINKGSIGFLTQISADAIESSLESIVSGNYRIIMRSQLYVEVFNKDGIRKGADICLNDCFICRGAKPHITKLLLKIDGQDVERFYGDGLVISTATGSTAYNLASGGPLLMPDMKDMIITSVCAHTLHTYSLVVGPESTIEIIVEDVETQPIICPDGRAFVDIEPYDRIVIRLNDKPVKTISIGPDSFFSDVRRKINQRGTFYENG